MPDPKGEWSLKENNSELHYGNIQKLITSSTPWSVLICQISGSYPKQFFRYFVHKVVPIQNACVWKRGISQPKIFRIGSKVYQFIYTLICYYMPNIRILAKLVLQIFCSQGCSNTKCLCLKTESNSTKNVRNRFKSQSVHLHLGLKLYDKYQDPSQCDSSVILFTRLFLYKMPVS